MLGVKWTAWSKNHGSEETARSFILRGRKKLISILKIIVAVLFVLIVGSLGFALVTLVKDRGKTKRTVHALTARVVLSILVFLILLIGFLSGGIAPHGIVP